MMTPSYGMAEATVYVSTAATGGAPVVVDFDPEKLAAGTAERCASEAGSPLISYGVPESPTVRIVDPDTCREMSRGHGRRDLGARRERGDRLLEQARGDGAHVRRHAGRPVPWHSRGSVAANGGPRFHLRGRAVHRGPHEGPVDRVRAQPLPRGHRGHGPGDHGWPGRGDIGAGGRTRRSWSPSSRSRSAATPTRRRCTSSASSRTTSPPPSRSAHGLNVADLVLVPPGSIPTTTSGKIRRAACVDQYRHQQFARLDA